MVAIPLPPPAIRPEEAQLRADVRWLAGALGRVIRRLEGEETFRAVEEMRQACRARRLGAPGAPTLDQLLERARAVPLETAARTARAFTLFFLLINTAEQVHRVRRRRHYQASGMQPGSAGAVFHALREQGQTAEAVGQTLAALEVRPVLTAHPTESTRRSILALQSRVADGLLARDRASDSERRAIERELEVEVELLWLTSEVRPERPSVLDEVRTVIWYLEDRLLPAEAGVREHLADAFAREFGGVLPPVTPLALGSWVGGDRDGNPFVTPETTRVAVRRASRAVLGHYARALDRLVERLSLSERLAGVPPALRASLERDREALPEVWERNRVRNADEPLRLKLSFMRERIEAARRLAAGREAGRPEPEPAAYTGADGFEADLALVAEALDRAGAVAARRELLDPLLAQVRAYGFFGYRLDLRDDAAVHTRALRELAGALQLEELDGEALRRELSGRRPLASPHLSLSEETRRTLEVFRAMRELQDEVGERAVSTYIVSRTRSADDLMRVLLLAREAGLVDLAAEPPRSRLDVVPLFETLDDLERAPAIVRGLLDDPVWSRQLAARGRHQEIMLGYSDSAKDAGVLPAAWALYRAQEEMAASCAAAGVAWTLFHGRGGTVGRGGGSPVRRAIAALPPKTVGPRIKVTEQGEVVSQNFGLLPLAERTLELLVSSVLRHGFEDWRVGLEPGEEARFRAIMEDLAARALPVYRDLVHGSDELFAFFQRVTPVRELAHVRFGSRPVYRENQESMAAIRAIPWVFGWTQMRLILPGWLGVGTALEGVGREPGGLEVLRRMAGVWPFFDDLLGKVEMVCAKADLAIAELYVRELGGDRALFDRLQQEFERTVTMLLRVRGTRHLLTDNPVLQSAIGLRNPYVDPLSLLQIALLGRKRALRLDDPALPLVEAALGTTLNGVAQGLRNTG